MKYKAVIFDFDDTLVESRLTKLAHYKYVGKKFYNIDLKEEVFLKHWGKPSDHLVCEFYKNSDTSENMMKVVASVRSVFPKKPYKGSANVIKKLLALDIKVGVLSAATRKFIIEDLARFDFPIDQLVAIQGFEETPVHKPDPGVFVPMFKELALKGIGKKSIVYVGDSISDLKAARDAGIDFIGITQGLYSKKDFAKEGAKVILSNIGELLGYV